MPETISIPKEAIVFDPASVADPNGKVFWWEGRVYRAVTGRAAALYRAILEDGAFDKLTGAGMIGTALTPFSVDGYDLVLSHDTILFRSYPFEWCDQMLRDAALVTCDLNLALTSMDLATQDSHPWNVFFDGPVPKWIDVGSIVAGKSDLRMWRDWYREFETYYLYPLHLMSSGQGAAARLLLYDQEGITRRRAARVMPIGEYIKSAREEFMGAPPRFSSAKKFLEHLRTSVERIKLEEPEPTPYDADDTGRTPDRAGATHSARAVLRDVLYRLAPSSVIDAGTGDYWPSRFAAGLGIPVVAFDADERRVRSLYEQALREGLNVLPLIMDVAEPSRAFTVPRMGDQYPGATERLKGEFVVGLSLVERLVTERGLALPEAVDRLAAFSTRYLLVDFIPPDLQDRRIRGLRRATSYSEGGLVEALRAHFARVERFDSATAEQRILLCER